MEGKKILFICLGNRCRSPIAEVVFNHQLHEKGIKGWHVDSAGIGGWFKGQLPDERARNVMKNYNITMDHRSRQITDDDFKHFDMIFGMDHDNIVDLSRLQPKGSKAKLELFGSYDPQKELIIRDPYYDDGDEGFQECYNQCMRCSEGFLKSLSN